MVDENFRAGDIILKVGEEGECAYLVRDGSVEVLVGTGAKETSVATLGPGAVFGEMSLLAPGPRSATVRATTDTECTVITYDEFMNSIRDNPERAVEFMQALVLRLRNMNESMATPGASRSIAGVIRDFFTPIDLDDATLSEEERERRRAVANMVIGF